MSVSFQSVANDQLSLTLANVHCDEAVQLIARLTAELAARYNDDGAGDFKASDMDKPGSGFLIGRWDGVAIACGAFRCLDPAWSANTGEIKRMFVEPAYRGRGVGRRLLAALEGHIREAGYTKIWLETGTAQPEAIQLYTAFGYREIERYGFYRDDPRSRCFEKVVVGE